MRPTRFTQLATLVLLTMACNCGQKGPVNRTPPEEAAKAFMAGLAIPYKGVSCTGGDTDFDGYVTCTVSVGDSQFMSLQCAAIGAGSNDCPNNCTQESPYTAGCKRTEDKVIPPAIIQVKQP
jgi:predicted small lipoprotein YifL